MYNLIYCIYDVQVHRPMKIAFCDTTQENTAMRQKAPVHHGRGFTDDRAMVSLPLAASRLVHCGWRPHCRTEGKKREGMRSIMGWNWGKKREREKQSSCGLCTASLPPRLPIVYLYDNVCTYCVFVRPGR